MAVGWQDTSGGDFVATSNDGGANWNFNRINQDLPYPCGFCDIDGIIVDVDAAGRVFTIWTDARNGNNDLFSNYSLDGGQTWQQVTFKATNTNTGAGAVTLIMGGLSDGSASQAKGNNNDDRLKVHATFFEPRPGAEGLYTSTATFSGTKSSMQRLSGSDRYKTGVAIAQNQFPTAGTVTSAVFATGENFPDGLAATPLAAMVNGPVYLVKQGSVPSEVAADFLRIYDKKSDARADAYIIGGTSALSASVESAIAALDPSIQTKRLAGAG